MAVILKGKTRIRVKAYEAPLTGSKILGQGIDMMSMPDGHVACAACQNPFFECWVYLDNHRVEIGCMKCGNSYRLLFPLDVDLSQFAGGRFVCFRHPNSGMVIIKNTDCVCIGCQLCKSQVTISLKKSQNLLVN